MDVLSRISSDPGAVAMIWKFVDGAEVLYGIKDD